MKHYRTLILWLLAPFGVTEKELLAPTERKLQKWENKGKNKIKNQNL